MAINLGTETLDVTKSERTWRVEIFCERGNDPIIRAHRETIWIASDGTLLRSERGVTVDRSLSQIATESHDGLTGAQLAGAIASRADFWRQQNIDAAAAAVAAAEGAGR
jgi:hypothetical protein